MTEVLNDTYMVVAIVTAIAGLAISIIAMRRSTTAMRFALRMAPLGQLSGTQSLWAVTEERPTPRRVQGYGWRPDIPDPRDLTYAIENPFHVLPDKVDLRTEQGLAWPVYDQGQLGSCTANAIAGAVRFLERKEGDHDVDPSRLFIYYEERKLEGSVGTDSGAQIRDGAKVVAKIGWPSEADWPYDISRFTDEPTAAVDKEASGNHVTRYYRVLQNVAFMQACLAEGYPFVGGVSVFESFEAATDGAIPMPQRGEQLLGGHAILFVGYDNATQRFTFRNSWGDGWGMSGYGTMPFAYLADGSLASDFWTFRAAKVA